MPDNALQLVPMERIDLRWLEACMRVEYSRAYAKANPTRATFTCIGFISHSPRTAVVLADGLCTR